MADLGESIWNFALQQQKTYLHYRSAHGHQTWRDGDLAWRVPSHMIFWSDGLARSRDKLEPLYLHYCSVYGYQNCWEDSDLPWGAPNHKITWLFDHVVLRYYLAN